MTVAYSTGAVSHPITDWHAIDWQQVHKSVRRLQARIVKATQAEKWGKVAALQRILTRSFSAKALAVRRVTENKGKNTPGVDGEIWNTPDKKLAGLNALQQRGYKPVPLRRIYIEKRNGKKRPLGIPTMRDRAMQALYLLAFDPVAEVLADPNSYGFRKERNCADAVQQCFGSLVRRINAQWILEGDIKACFDKLSHEWLLENIPIEKGILRKWLKTGYIERDVFHKTEAGTPQGGIISPVLANQALDGLEALIRARFPKTTKTGKRAKVNLIRYADDFVITGASRELLEEVVRPLVEQFLAERSLELSPEKTTITHIEDGFDFLGQNIRKYNGTLIIKPSKNSTQNLLQRVRLIIKANKNLPAGKLIWLLNPIIRGWALYHRHVCSKKTFQKVDHLIFQAIWRWACRRHPNKGKRWVKRKYFKRVAGRDWTFFGMLGDSERYLFRASQLPIRRHIKIKGDANPYDPEWERYFEQRLDRKMAESMRSRRKLLKMWREQHGICCVCKEKITHLTGWHTHHLTPRVLGGTDKIENLILLHPNCHRQVHHLNLQLEKPRPAIGRS